MLTGHDQNLSRTSSLKENLAKIEEYFAQIPSRAFSEKTIYNIYYSNKNDWDSPSANSPRRFIEFLEKQGFLKKTIFKSPSNIDKVIYSWKTEDDYTIISGLKNNAYFTHYSAMALHGLTLQIPKVYYLNYEHSKEFEYTELTQESIESALSKEQRKASVSYNYQSRKIIILNGKKTGDLGVIINENINRFYYYTDLERTLIDIAVRPAYAGGVFEALEAFIRAKPNLDIYKLEAYLNKLNFIYPYHQVIGFYLEKAGYTNEHLNLFQKNIKFDFYLSYAIRNKAFSEKWRLYYPKGM